MRFLNDPSALKRSGFSSAKETAAVRRQGLRSGDFFAVKKYPLSVLLAKPAEKAVPDSAVAQQFLPDAD